MATSSLTRTRTDRWTVICCHAVRIDDSRICSPHTHTETMDQIWMVFVSLLLLLAAKVEGTANQRILRPAFVAERHGSEFGALNVLSVRGGADVLEEVDDDDEDEEEEEEEVERLAVQKNSTS